MFPQGIASMDTLGKTQTACFGILWVFFFFFHFFVDTYLVNIYKYI